MIDALALEKPILLGHSIGGAIATFAAQAAGDRIGGLVLFDAVVGDRRFVEKASFVVEEFGASLEHRFADFDEYQAHWGIEPDDSAWRRWLERSQRMELVPLPDGTLRPRSLRDALAMEWSSIARADALAALADVTVPVWSASAGRLRGCALVHSPISRGRSRAPRRGARRGRPKGRGAARVRPLPTDRA